jgi:hypothetical protein
LLGTLQLGFSQTVGREQITIALRNRLWLIAKSDANAAFAFPAYFSFEGIKSAQKETACTLLLFQLPNRTHPNTAGGKVDDLAVDAAISRIDQSRFQYWIAAILAPVSAIARIKRQNIRLRYGRLKRLLHWRTLAAAGSGF